MKPFEKDVVLPRLREANLRFGAVTGVTLAALNGWSERTTRQWLRRLEMAGFVMRPLGDRSGWLVR